MARYINIRFWFNNAGIPAGGSVPTGHWVRVAFLRPRANVNAGTTSSYNLSTAFEGALAPTNNTDYFDHLLYEVLLDEVILLGNG